MADVFISYARRSAAQAEAAAAALGQLGYSVWFDRQLPAHRSYSQVIEEELGAAAAVLVLWCDEAVRSQWVRSEANRGREAGKLIQASVEPVRLPMPFDQIQCADLSGWPETADTHGWRAALASVAQLVGSTRQPKSPVTPANGSAAAAHEERRRLCFLDCRLEPRPGAAMDPEERQALRQEVRTALSACAAKFGGRLLRSEGGEVACFGYPEALEDAAGSAVRAGLEVLDALDGVAPRFEAAIGGPLLRLAGVHAGIVVVGERDATTELAGEAPAMAGTVAAAAPGRLVITEPVRELCSGAFLVEPVEGADLFTIAGARPTVERSPASSSPFVGREEELAILSGRWRRAKGGAGQLVLVAGEPGIGKSRLLEAFRAELAGEAHRWLQAAGEPVFANTPFRAVGEMLRGALGGGDDAAIAEALEPALSRAGVEVGEAVVLVCGMLGVPPPSRFGPLSLSPDQQRARLLKVLAQWVLSAAGDQPLVVVVEDLQWLDPSSLELFEALVEQASGSPVLLVGVARPEFRPSWGVRRHQTQITLDRLSDAETRALVRGLAAKAGLGEELTAAVVGRADGVPLFAEALTQLMLESGEAAESIPATLLDSLMARLDRLGGARSVAQTASVIGREFSYALLSAVSELDDAALEAALAALVSAELIEPRGAPPSASYHFRHALIHDAAYDGLLKRTRRTLHGRVAAALRDRFADIADAHPEVLARHWSLAGDARLAAEAWQRAGDRAFDRRAFREAEAQFRNGLQGLRQVQSQEAQQLELELASALGRVLQITRGYAAPEAVKAAAEARALAEKAGSLPQLIREEARIWRAVITSGDYRAASAQADRILELSGEEAASHPVRLIFALNAQVQTRFYTADLAGVEAHFEKLSLLLDLPDVRQAPGNNVIAIGVASLNAWALGRHDTARERIERALAMAERSQDPYDTAMALHFLGNLCTLERDPDRTEAIATRLMSLARDNGFTYVAALAAAPLGWARAHKGGGDEAVALIRTSMAEQVETGARVAVTNWLNRLAEAEALAGRTDEALASVEAALVANPDERFFRPESLRLRGVLRRERDGEAAAEADLRAALDLARSFGARAWELRAAVSLGQLYAPRDDRDAVQGLIQPLLASYPQPAVSRDVQQAWALLNPASEGAG